MRILLIDHSVIAYKSFWRLFSEDYEGETDDERYEFTRSYCGMIEYYNELFKPDGILWLLDCERKDIWRHGIVENYYLPRTKIWANVDNETLAGLESPNSADCFMGVSDGIYRKVFTDAAGVLHGKQLFKKSFDAAAEDWDMDARLITDETVFSTVAEKVYPRYKGNREGSHWPRGTVLNKTEFQRLSLQLAKDIAPHYNGKLAKGANLEADDLAYAACQRYPKAEITAITTDGDWSQLSLLHPNFEIFDPNKYEILPSDRDVVLAAMWEKMLSGDSSDNIKSVRVDGQVSGIGEKRAKALIETHGAKAMKKWAQENCEEGALQKNKVLINLKEAPQKMRERAATSIEDAYKPPSDRPLTFFVSAATLELARADAQKKAMLWDMLAKGKKDDK